MSIMCRLKGLLLLLLVVALATATGADDSTRKSATLASASYTIDFDELAEAFAASGDRADVIVTLRAPAAQAAVNWKSETSRVQLRREARALQDATLARLQPGGFEVVHRFENVAGFSGYVTIEGLARLLDDPNVIHVKTNRILHAHLAQGIPLIHADTYRGTYNGQNMAIAICDTGVDTSHPRLGGGGFPNAKVIGGYDTGDNDADPRPNAMLGEAHGTACAGIAAGDTGTVGDYIGGVAYGAKLYAIKISTGNTGNATEAAMIAGWDWCVTHQNDNASYPIMVISTSFGGGRYTSTCDADSPAMTTAAANAVAAGITVLASSGNDGYCDSMGWPACITHAISVGAVYDANVGTGNWCVSGDSCHPDKQPTGGCTTGWYVPDPSAADKVTAYSNSASFLDIFASSNNAYTCDIVGVGGYDTGDYDLTFGGTSAACPYAAGAVAALQSAAKAVTGYYLTPAQVRSLLATTGDPITDTKVAITKPRVNLAAAINGLGGPIPTPTPPPTVTPSPTPSECPNNVVSDPGFEAGTPSTEWTESSTNFGTPLCTINTCGAGTGTGPHSGAWWAWFGGTTLAEDAAVEQNVTIPSGATLKFYLEIPAAGTTGYMRVLIGESQVFQVTQADAAAYATYQLVTVDVSAYAGNHTLRFESHTDAGSSALNFFVDDICLAGANVPTPTPTPSTPPTPTCPPDPTPAPFDLDDLKITTNGDMDDTNWQSQGILRIENATNVTIKSAIKGEIPGMIPVLEIDGSIKKISTSIPIHRVKVDKELGNFNGQSTYARIIEAGGLGIIKMSAVGGSETPYVQIIGKGDSDKTVNAVLMGVTLAKFAAPDQKAIVKVMTKKKKGELYRGKIAPRPGCVASSVISAEEFGLISVSGGNIEPYRILSDGKITKISAKNALGLDGQVGTEPFGPSRLEVWAGQGSSSSDINTIVGDAGVFGKFVTGKITSDNGSCVGDGLIKKMQTRKGSDIAGNAYVSDKSRLKFVGGDASDMNVNACEALSAEP